jgi:hypothetical protein
MALLLFLYLLQGIPMGLASSVPLILGSKGASFSDQALFSLASWPYALKLAWAPLVDALWTPRFGLGQRKSWVVPVQIVTGVIMIALGARIGDFFGGGAPESGEAGSSSGGIDVMGLLVCFFLLYFLVATQDIAVDGWALTMLRPENVGYASTANTVGQMVGAMTSYSLFLALDSAATCNAYIRAPLGLPPQDIGLVTMGGFMSFWGTVFIVTTLVMWVVKKEEDAAEDNTTAGGAPPPSSSARVAGGGGAAAYVRGEGEGGTAPSRPQRSAASPSSRSSSAGRRGRTTSVGNAPASDVAAAAAAASAVDVGLSNPASASDSSESSVGSVRRRSNGRRGSASGGKGAAANAVAASTASAEDSDDIDGRRAEEGAGGSGGGSGASTAAADAERDDEAGALLGSSSSSAPHPSSSTPSSSPSPRPGCAAAASNVASTYRDFFSILRLLPVLSLVLVMVTVKAGFQATDRATTLIAQSRGVPKETLALLDMVSFPLQLAIPVFLSRFTAGRQSLSIFLAAFPVRAAFGLVWLWTLYVALPDRHATPWSPDEVPWSVLALVFLVSNLHALAQTAMFMGQMSFFTQVAAPNSAIGGTYITLLNTVTNLGSMWPGPLTLKAIDDLTVARCEYAEAVAHARGVPPWNATRAEEIAAGALTCKGAAGVAECAAAGGACGVQQDGYVIMVVVGTVYSLVWWLLMRRRVQGLQGLPSEAWKVVRGR